VFTRTLQTTLGLIKEVNVPVATVAHLHSR
jgi:hypothetical protein